MKGTRIMIAAWAVSQALRATGETAPSQWLPPGIAIRMTSEGPVFVDARGMTLYKINKQLSSAIESCDDRPDKVLLQTALEGRLDFEVLVPDGKTRSTCA